MHQKFDLSFHFRTEKSTLGGLDRYDCCLSHNLQVADGVAENLQLPLTEHVLILNGNKHGLTFFESFVPHSAKIVDLFLFSWKWHHNITTVLPRNPNIYRNLHTRSLFSLPTVISHCVSVAFVLIIERMKVLMIQQ